MLFVTQPLPSVHRPISMQVNTFSFGFIIDPIPFVDIPTRVDEPTLTVGQVIVENSLINGPISPDLFASAAFFIIFPLTVVHDTFLILLRLLPFMLEIGSEFERSILFVDLSDFLWTLIGELIGGQLGKGTGFRDEKYIGVGSLMNVFASLAVSHLVFKNQSQKIVSIICFNLNLSIHYDKVNTLIFIQIKGQYEAMSLVIKFETKSSQQQKRWVAAIPNHKQFSLPKEIRTLKVLLRTKDRQQQLNCQEINQISRMGWQVHLQKRNQIQSRIRLIARKSNTGLKA